MHTEAEMKKRIIKMWLKGMYVSDRKEIAKFIADSFCEVCSVCRREKEKMYKREKRKAATASNGKSGNPIRLPLNLLTGNF